MCSLGRRSQTANARRGQTFGVANNPGPSRLERLVEGNRQSGLEMIVGPARYVDELILNSVVWIGGMVLGGVVAFVLAGTELGLNRAGLAVVISWCVAV